MPRKLSIVVPVYNEEKMIEPVLRLLVKLKFDKEIVIVNDGSTDGTAEKISELHLEENPRFRIIHLPKNRGKGAAVRAGFEAARGFWAVIFDADLEYDPNDLERLLETAEKFFPDGRGAVFGSRFLGDYSKKFAFHYLVNGFLTLATNLLFGSRLTDMETCLKLSSVKVLRELDLRANGFDIEPEITCHLLKKDIPIKEIAAKNYWRRGYGQGKKIKPKDGFIALKKLYEEKFGAN